MSSVRPPRFAGAVLKRLFPLHQMVVKHWLQLIFLSASEDILTSTLANSFSIFMTRRLFGEMPVLEEL